MEADKKVARGYKVTSSVPTATEPSTPAAAEPSTPAETHDVLEDEVFVAAAAVVDDLDLHLESDDDQNNAEIMADANNSFEEEEPTIRKAGVGRRVLPSRKEVRSTPSSHVHVPVASRYVDL